VDRLVRRKYLKRTEARSDRRSSDLSLAVAGRKLLDKYEASKRRQLSKVFADLDPEDLRRTADFLERLTKGIVHDSANPEEICLQCGIYLKKRCLVREASEADCHYQLRKTKQLVRTTRQKVRSDAPRTKVPTRGGPPMGPPG
jgi:hypothetical protein